MADEDEAVDLNAQIEVGIAPYGSLDLDADWVAYLNQSAEIPPNVDGVDPSINYEEDGGNAVV
jgi:hypothetical protein